MYFFLKLSQVQSIKLSHMHSGSAKVSFQYTQTQSSSFKFLQVHSSVLYHIKLSSKFRCIVNTKKLKQQNQIFKIVMFTICVYWFHNVQGLPGLKC